MVQPAVVIISRIFDVRWYKEAFQKVVLDRRTKDVIRALLRNQLTAEVSTDLTKGKGNGLFMAVLGLARL